MSPFPALETHEALCGRPFWSRLLVVVSLATAASLLGCASNTDDTAEPTDYGKPDGSTTPTDGGKDSTTDGPDACVPKTCSQLEATCGSAPDGCGGKITCGICPDGQQCGGGGTNKCGMDQCSPKSCSSLSASCGYVSDGCSEAIDCGECPSPMSCGGGGKPNQCGCVPKTCAQMGASCGSVPDGCDGKLECGSCPTGQTCGGGGAANTCGSGVCTAKTCSQQSASCGFVSDGCSKAIDCGECSGTNVCGGGGKANQCGCTPRSCVQVGVSCGQASDGCGVNIDCGSCPDGETCGGNGTAGQCGCTCSAPNASTNCSAGACTIIKCDAGWDDCDGDLVNGCETDIRTNVQNCGGCGNGCAFDNAGAVCVGAQCLPGACNNGFANCDGVAANGCEADTNNDAMHCGSCSTVCDAANGTPDCSGGNCGVACNSGWGDCNGSVVDGCETDLTTTVDHCGGCATDCSQFPTNVADATCGSSNCGIVSCVSGAYDQNSTFADGCECVDDGFPAGCAGAFQIPPGTVAVGGATDQNGSLTPTGDEDWFVVNFSGANQCDYHPRVELQDQSGTGSIRMDVTTDCGGTAIACSEGGTSLAQLVWEFTYNNSCGGGLALDPSKLASSPTSVYVHVYATGPSTTCLPYVVHITN